MSRPKDDEQLSLPGVEPAAMKRRPQAASYPSADEADAEALRDFVANETCEPGTIGAMNFDQLLRIKAKLTMTAEERARLLALAEKWEKDG